MTGWFVLHPEVLAQIAQAPRVLIIIALGFIGAAALILALLSNHK